MTSRSDIHILQAVSGNDIAAVKALFLDYIKFIESYLGQSLEFQNTQAEFADFPQIYDALFLAKCGSTPLGACAVKPFGPGICELKRLYCKAEARGQGLGARLTQDAIKFAKGFGYHTMYLDTDYGLTQANRIYEALGFKDIDKYYDTPIESRFMARQLTEPL